MAHLVLSTQGRQSGRRRDKFAGPGFSLTMIKVFEKQVFEGFYDRNSGALFSDLAFRRCSFEGCAISITRKPELRSTVRNASLLNCDVRGCTIDGAIIEEVLIENLKTYTLLQAWAAVFRHVVLRGKIGRIMLSPYVATGTAKPDEQEAFDEANSAYYETVDWALDIQEAEFEEFDNRCIPGRLIRRDPETQVLVTRAKAARGEFRKLDLSKTIWREWLELFLQSGEQDVVLVAPKRARDFRALLDGLRKLREAGIAEPD